MLHYEGREHELSAGDAIYYDATAAHEIECLGEIPAVIITVYVKSSPIAPSNGRPVTIEGHL